MNILLRSCAVVSLIAALILPVAVSAAEHENYSKDAAGAENTPPMIPHRIKESAGGTYCLECHETGKHGAPMTPHPERLSCTGCHGQGEIQESKPQKPGTK